MASWAFRALIPGALVRRIRDGGAQQGVISTRDLDAKRLVEKAQAAPSLVGRDLVKEVTCREPYDWSQGYWELEGGYRQQGIGHAPEPRFSVVAYDFGVKFNILRHLVEAGCRVRVVPAHTWARLSAEVLGLKPDGVFLSNGPGDPDALPYAKENIAAPGRKSPLVWYLSGTPDSGVWRWAGRPINSNSRHHGGNQPGDGSRNPEG